MARAKRPAPMAGLLVADTGPLIVLGLAQLLAVAAELYGSLAVPEAVADECLAQAGLPGEAQVRAGIRLGHVRIVRVGPLKEAEGAALQGLGAGEMAVLAHARAHGLTVLIDERRARRTAHRLGVARIGSGAILVGLKQHGRIPSVKAVLDQWTAHGYFVSKAVRSELLAAAGE